MNRRAGWTMIELLIVMVILGLLATIAVLKYIDLSRTAFAAKIVGEFTTVRLAAYNYEADNNNQWPSDQGPGIVPPEMIPYLPPGFDFVYTTYQLDWDNRLPSLDPFGVAISMTSTDPALMRALQNTLGTNAPYFFSGNRLTFIIVDRTGNY